MVGHEDDLHAGGAAVLDDLHLGVEQGLSARAAIDVVGDAVELQIERRQSGRLRLLRELEIGQFDAVGRGLNVGEAHLARHATESRRTAGWMVGSPPENCTTRPSTGRSPRSVCSMLRTCSMSGSYR